jgi:predicted Zn-dependent protease
MARSGDLPHAQSIADDLNRRFPVNTMIQNVWLPTIRAQIELAHGNGAKAVELLKSATSYELGEGIGSLNFVCILPAYTRGEAFLAAKDGASAAAEFQKILDHPGLMLNDPVGPMARLQLARAQAASGDRAKSAATYKSLLAIWKDADPDLPAIQQAKSESTKLQ